MPFFFSRFVTGSNDNFKKRLLPLEGHKAMMEAVGFKAKANLWEWTWHEERRVVAFGADDCIDCCVGAWLCHEGF